MNTERKFFGRHHLFIFDFKLDQSSILQALNKYARFVVLCILLPIDVNVFYQMAQAHAQTVCIH